jgi:hypothetical protein
MPQHCCVSFHATTCSACVPTCAVSSPPAASSLPCAWPEPGGPRSSYTWWYYRYAYQAGNATWQSCISLYSVCFLSSRQQSRRVLLHCSIHRAASTKRDKACPWSSENESCSCPRRWRRTHRRGGLCTWYRRYWGRRETGACRISGCVHHSHQGPAPPPEPADCLM